MKTNNMQLKRLFLLPIGLLTTLSMTLLISEKTMSKTTVLSNFKVCNKSQDKIYLARAIREKIHVLGGRNYGNPYGRELHASRVSGWNSISPGQCKSFYSLSLKLDIPYRAKFLGGENWIYIESSNKKKIPSQKVEKYIDSRGNRLLKPEFCVTNKGFDFSSKSYKSINSKATCPGHNTFQGKYIFSKGEYFVKFKPISHNETIIFK